MSSSHALRDGVQAQTAVDNRAHGQEACADWLRTTLSRVIAEQRPRIPGWGLLRPYQIVGEYSADEDYLLLVFDHRGQPHTRRFTLEEVRRFNAIGEEAERSFRHLIQSLCSHA
jgi:hypothetical protein